MNYARDTDADLSATGEAIRLDTQKDQILGVHIRGVDGAEYALDVSNDPDGDGWLQGIDTFSGLSQSDYDVLYPERPERHVRIRITSTSDGDTADIYLSSA